jgi:hypothetical protein
MLLCIIVEWYNSIHTQYHPLPYMFVIYIHLKMLLYVLSTLPLSYVFMRVDIFAVKFNVTDFKWYLTKLCIIASQKYSF